MSAGPPDTSTPNVARIYDAWLGGKDNFRVDRVVAARVAEIAPFVVQAARANRAFLRRAVAHLAAAGIDQFLDLGSGLPGPGNVHEVARGVIPGAKVVYLDNDPVVATYARALLACDEQTIAVEGDLRDPEAILRNPRIQRHLDLRRPVGVLMVAVLHFVIEQDDPRRIVATFRDRVASGSYVVLSHASTPDARERDCQPGDPERPDSGAVLAGRQAAALYTQLAGPFTTRTPSEIESLFEGWDLVPPGVVPANLWRPVRRQGHAPLAIHAGVGCLGRR